MTRQSDTIQALLKEREIATLRERAKRAVKLAQH